VAASGLSTRHRRAMAGVIVARAGRNGGSSARSACTGERSLTPGVRCRRLMRSGFGPVLGVREARGSRRQATTLLGTLAEAWVRGLLGRGRRPRQRRIQPRAPRLGGPVVGVELVRAAQVVMVRQRCSARRAPADRPLRAFASSAAHVAGHPARRVAWDGPATTRRPLRRTATTSRRPPSSSQGARMPRIGGIARPPLVRAPPPTATINFPPPGRVAQWESARFTRERSLVRNQPRPSSERLPPCGPFSFQRPLVTDAPTSVIACVGPFVGPNDRRSGSSGKRMSCQISASSTRWRCITCA
jgi:hypothetical protein